MILHLETSTKLCSVALSEHGKLIDFIDASGDHFIHGEALTVMITQLLRRNSVKIDLLLGISVSLGPGSYTGLRIGLATAKGLAYGLNIPCIGVSSLESLVVLAQEKYPEAVIAAAFDARRDEVFVRIEAQNTLLWTDQPVIITTALSFPPHDLVWVGDANSKLKALLPDRLADTFDDEVQPSARGQVAIVYQRFASGNVDHLDDLTPNYTKAFYSGTTKA